MNKTEYWLDIADYDYQTALDLQKSKRWLYVAFMCHQVIEKTLKAYWCAKLPDDPPYTHNIVKLSIDSGLSQMMTNEQNAFIDSMMPLNIEARYPEYKEKLLQRLTPEICATIITNTHSLQLWIREQL